MTQPLLKDLPVEKGHPVAHMLRVSNFELKTAKNNRQYITFKGSDSSRTVSCKKWDSDEDDLNRYKACKVLFLTGKVDPYNGALSIVAEALAEPEEEVVTKFLADNPEQSSTSASSNGPISEVTLAPERRADIKKALTLQAPLKTMKPDDKIDHILRLASIEVKDAKNGKPFAKLKLSDSTAEMQASMFDIEPDFANKYKDVKAIYAVGFIQVYQGTNQIKILGLQMLPLKEEEVSLLMISSTYDLVFLKKGIWNLIKRMQNPWLRQICEAFITDPKLKDRFSLVPAGVSRHHSFRHGLIEHTYRLMILAGDFVDSYNKHSWPGNNVFLDRDTILAGCLFHDMQKAFEYAVDGSYDVEGSKLGHIARGIMELGSKTALIPGFPDELKELLVHIVSSHHGLTEWGSPDTPSCPEAIIVHYLDNLCSKLDPTVMELNSLAGDTKWTEKPVKALSNPGEPSKRAYLGNCTIIKNAVTSEGLPASAGDSTQV